MLYQSLYKHTGVFVGTPMIGMINLSPNAASLLLRVEGVLRWQKDAQTAAKERNYKEGFGPVDVKLLGTNYKHTKGKVVLNLPDVQTGGSNARLIFEGGGLDGASKNPNVPAVRITSSNSIVLPTASDPDHPNLANVKLKVNADSGTMSGSFELDDDGVKRTASFTGLLIPRIPVTPQLNYSDDTMMSAEIPGVDATGVGYFQLAKLPSAEDGTTLSTSPLLSGSVRLKPAPINILTQPVSAAVNPGGIVGFSVVAESIPLKDGSLLPLSYQWRKDGVSISGATETSYTINGVVDSNAGNYDVVISSSASQVISATAVLTVNKPVSDIVITREPGTTKVAIGSEVTFTAAANGTMPFTYQWYWNSDPIEGANDVSYTIPIADVSHSGAYSVRVGNVASQPGEMSGSVSLWVVEGVSNPMVARTVPAPELDVFYGAQVTLMASANGEGPFSYQWYFGEDENLSEINGATQETYSFFAATTQSGYYRVKVMSEATPEGVMSDPLIVPVRTEVSNVVASRTGGSTVSLGESITFSVTAQGEPELSFQWQRDTGEGFMNIPDAIYADYSISVTENDAGRYRVLVSNGATPDGVYSNEVELVIGGLGGE
jgi:hypothetical protein